MIRYLLTYGATLVAFLAFDFVWLGFIATRFYREQLGPMMLEKPLLGVAFAFYAIYAIGIVVLAVLPGLREENWRTAAMLGALLGLVAYGTYDLTNFSTLKGWPIMMTFVDMAWGTVLTAIAATAGYFAASLLK
ncbi:MAG: rane protein [Hyphomicrobiales bacterium]|nr:rane protein [Hyphomicrobiales bacterium]